MKTRYLKFALLAMIFAGIFFTSIPFVGSLSPSQKADSLVALVNVDELDRGTFVEVQSQYGQVFALLDENDELRVYLVPHHDGQYWLPDPNWERPFYPCKEFGPDSEGNKLAAGGLFRCRESHVEWMTTDESMTWEFSGENKAGYIDDMRVPKFDLVGNQIVVKGR